MILPPVLHFIIIDFPGQGIGNAGDPVLTLDDAADAVAESHRQWGDDISIRVLRIADSMNVDDVTVCAYDLIARRIAQKELAA